MVKDYKEKKITINLTKVFAKPVTKRAKGAVFMVRAKVTKETRAKEVLLSNKVNELLWEKGLYSCPRKITVKVVKEKENVRVYLPDEKVIEAKVEKKKEKGLKAKAEEIAGKKVEKKEEAKVEKAPKSEVKKEDAPAKKEDKKEPAKEKKE